MAYNRTFWQDHVTQYEDRFKEVQNTDGTITHTPIEGEVLQQGTPQNQTNFNNIEEGIFAGNEFGAEAMRLLLHHVQNLKKLNGEVGTVALSNTLAYPFNDSVKTVSLATKRDTTDYDVSIDATSADGGGIGHVIVSDKQVNGFKISFTGGAKTVNVKYIVTGGVY